MGNINFQQEFKLNWSDPLNFDYNSLTSNTLFIGKVVYIT